VKGTLKFLMLLFLVLLYLTKILVERLLRPILISLMGNRKGAGRAAHPRAVLPADRPVQPGTPRELDKSRI
jgi:hypothetical protein